MEKNILKVVVLIVVLSVCNAIEVFHKPPKVSAYQYKTVWYDQHVSSQKFSLTLYDF